jgi:hypothetical protein
MKGSLKEEGQPLSQDGWPFLLYGHRSYVFPKESGSAVLRVRCSGKNYKLKSGLPSRGGTRATQWATRPVFDGVDSTPRHIDDGVLAIRNTLDAGLPNLLHHIQAHHDEGNGRKSERKKRKGCNELAHEIQLQRDNNPQEPPHPLPLAVFVFHLSSDPHRTEHWACCCFTWPAPLRCVRPAVWSRLADLSH